jgi:hypothetical protein
MINCNIYAIFAGNWNGLDQQLSSLERHATDCAIIVIEDGHYPCDGQCPVKHTTIYTPRVTAPTGFRSGMIIESLLRDVIPQQHPRYAICLHGDMLAVESFSAMSLFQDKTYVVAGRYPRWSTTPKWATQMLGIDRSQSLLPEWWKWNHEYAQIYPVRIETREHRQHIEWIGPFKHLTAMGVNLCDTNPLP